MTWSRYKWKTIFKGVRELFVLAVRCQFQEDDFVAGRWEADYLGLSPDGANQGQWAEANPHETSGCSGNCARLAKVVEDFWDKLAPKALAELMHNFSRHPSLLPPTLVEKAMASDDEELNRVAIEALFELDPGRLVSARGAVRSIDEMLRETSANTGVLFFADRLYSPKNAGFVLYRGAA